MSNIEQPCWASIPYRDPFEYALIFSNLNYLVFLDSMKFDPKVGRYSYVAIDPFATLIYRNEKIYFNSRVVNEKNVFIFLKNKLNTLSVSVNPDLPPFQGGVAGFFSYDLIRDFENLPNYAVDDMCYPRLAIGFYDLIISFDHLKREAWVVSSGLPEKITERKKRRSWLRLSWCLRELQNLKTLQLTKTNKPLVTDIHGNFNKRMYVRAIEKCRRYIMDGEIFQINLSQRFHSIFPNNSEFALYQKIRAINPAPFGAFVRFDDTTIVSSSPERFLKVQGRLVETRPIKGTIKRSGDIKKDGLLAMKLAGSLKDLSENTMIVDLMRNDLSKVCLPNSIHVPVYCQIESYETVHHLVSVIGGKLKDDYHAVDLLFAAFPGGSISGAPKIRAMEIIEELEPTRRGPYCGSLGYIGFNGVMDTSILIRSYVIKNKVITFQVGGAIVLDSDALSEYEETLVKAEALTRALVTNV